jgi:Lrp/AsnC family transcriptional regulator, leucine-responsive regulatory protein
MEIAYFTGESDGVFADMGQEVRQMQLFTYTPASDLLDAVNIRLLRELQGDPQVTMAELGRRIGMSSPAVAERVRRMEEAGIIVGYALTIDPASLGLPIAAYIRIRPHAGQLPQIAELARSIPEVAECHRITGEDCFLMKVHIPSMEQLDRILDCFLLYGSTTTSIIQSSPVPLRPPPLPHGKADS